jgi:adenylosuccinate lyase
VLRNIGAAAGHCLLSYQSLRRGLGKLEVDRARLEADLDAHWEVLAEAIQTVLRKHGVADAYEQLKELTRGQRVDRESLLALVDGLPLPEEEKRRLRALSPATYVGNAAAQARRSLAR